MRANELPGGMPFLCFHNMDYENFDVESGFPVAREIEGQDDITAILIPTQKVVSAIDLGSDDKQGSTLKKIFAWIQINGYETKGEIYYQYLNDTWRPENELLTMMTVPIK